MKTKTTARLAIVIFALAAMLLGACAPSPVFQTINAPLYSDSAEQPAAAPTAGLLESAPPADAEKAGTDGGAAPSVGGVTDNNVTLPDVPEQGAGRMIIKNADVKLQVEDTDTAINLTTQIVGDVGGYIISSRIWYQDYSGTNYKYATISIGVPVDEFERAMNRLRKLAVRVLDENASGQDVTSEFVDLQSQLGNLEATRDRIRSFLEDAKTVEESLRINQELSTIEDQIEKVKGRMNFLNGRSSYSTITVTLQPDLPALTPTPTPTPRPTATPTVWNPGKTFDSATHTVTAAYQTIIELLIGFFVVVVPLIAPPLLILWLIWKFLTRKKKPASGG